MLEEAKKVRHLFVEHKEDQLINGYNHSGWESLVIHGLESCKTRHYRYYGYKKEEDTAYIWTTISKLCPITTNWLKNTFPLEHYFRVRFMILKPGGYILPHRDGDNHELGKINIALNHPEGCIFKMKEHGVVPMKPGTVMFLDVFNEHAYINKSKEDRIHIIIHPGNPNTEYEELVENSYNRFKESKNGI
jgi:hypothetical protein